MQSIIFACVSLAIAAISFTVGAAKVFGTGKPFYNKIIIGAVGCYLLQEIATVCEYFCGGFDMYSSSFIDSIGTISFICLIYSAEKYIVKEAKMRRNAVLAIVLSIISVGLTVWMFSLLHASMGIVLSVMTCAGTLLEIPAAYYCLQHLRATKEQKNLAATKPCALISFILFCCGYVYFLGFTYGSSVFLNVFSVAETLMIALLTIFAIRGTKKWSC